MKKKLLVIIMILASISRIFGAIIMINVEPKSENLNENAFKQVIGLFEDGAMDLLFERGHIVCNTKIKKDSPVIKKEEALSLASVSGAEFFLNIILSYSDYSQRYVPESAEYSLMEMDGLTVLSEGIIKADSIPDFDKMKWDELNQELGKKLMENLFSKNMRGF